MDPQILSPDPTIEGVVKSFENGQKSQGLFSSEGGMFFGRYGMNKENLIKTISGLSRFWDGGEVRRKRSARGESVFLHDRKLSLNLMVQPPIFHTSCNNTLLRQQGLMGRMLIVKPKSLRGTRRYKAISINALVSLPRFMGRIGDLLGGGHADALDPVALPLSKDAKIWWIDFYNQAELQQAKSGKYERIPEAASKIAENAARLACVLAVFKNNHAEVIDEESMTCGVKLAQFFLDMQLHLFSPQEEFEDRARAIKLWGWLEPYINRKNATEVSKRDIQNRGPSEFKSSVQNIYTAMATLVDAGYFKK